MNKGFLEERKTVEIEHGREEKWSVASRNLKTISNKSQRTPH